MRVTIGKEFTFDSAHYLPDRKIYGKCATMHGHTYKLIVEVTGEIQRDGMICNFSELKKIIDKEIIAKFDHKDLTQEMDWVTTAENMAAHFFTKLNILLKEKHYSVTKIILYETPTSYCKVSDV